MSTPSDEFIASVPLEFCELTDDDMLENTKPNLISFSLSTTSSSYNISPTTNVITCSNMDYIQENICEDNARSLSRSISKEVQNIYCKESELHISPPMNLKLLSQERNLKSPSEANRPRTSPHMSSSESSAVPTLENECNSTITSSSHPSINNHQKKLSLSMHNLYDGLCNSNSKIVRFSSQPQLNVESSLYIARTPILEKKIQKYVHIESKVKQYIEFLKKDNVKASDDHSNPPNDNTNTIHSDKSLLVHEMQLEIEKLQQYLQERDIVLQEVQANHHTLLLQYAEAQNRLDELRLSSLAPQCDITFIPTKQFCRELPPEPLDRIKFEELNNNEERNPTRNSLLSYQHVSEISDKLDTKRDSGSEFNQSLSCQSESSVSGTTENCSDSQNMAYIKVAKWCTSLPTELLPVPSCYGSLGSIDFGSKRQRCSNLIDCCYGENARSASPSNYECWCTTSFFKPCKSNKYIKNSHCSMKTTNNNHPVTQKCCKSCSVPECTKYSSAAQNNFYLGGNHSPRNVIDVPPLNLVDSVDGTQTCPSGCELSESENVFPNTLSSVDDRCSESKDIKSSLRTNSAMHYLESIGTSTSYKSIFIKNNVDQEKHCIKCREHCPSEIMKQKLIKLNHSPLIATLKCQNHDKVNISPEGNYLLSKKKLNYICKCRYLDNASNNQQSRFNTGLEKSSKLEQFPSVQSLPVFTQYLNTVTVCAQDLKRKTEALHEYLTCLLKSVSTD